MKPRRLKLESGIWRFTVRGPVTTLWTPSGKRLSISNWEIAGTPPGTHTCWEDSCSGHKHPVTPGPLRRYIEANLL